MARIRSATSRTQQVRNGYEVRVTRVDVIIELTAVEAAKLPPPSRVGPNFPYAAEVDSLVTWKGGEIALRFFTSDRPFNNAPPEAIPGLALKAVQRWLDDGAPGSKKPRGKGK